MITVTINFDDFVYTYYVLPEWEPQYIPTIAVL
jgi:hypothetical protein